MHILYIEQLHGTAMGSAYFYYAKHQGRSPDLAAYAWMNNIVQKTDTYMY